MNKTIVGLLSFTSGIIVGAMATKNYFDKYYSAVAANEIEEIKSRYTVPKEDSDKEIEETAEDVVEEQPKKASVVRSGMQKAVKKNGYVAYNEMAQVVKDVNPADEPREYRRIIHPDDFATEPGYDIICYTFYSGDNILVDENDNVVDNRDCIVEDFADHFGEFEEGLVHIQNDEIQAYYEIALDYRSYYDEDDK